MKNTIIFFLLLFWFKNSNSQITYMSKPGLDKFSGWWRYVNGQDTITFHNTVRWFVASDQLQLKGLYCYMDYVRGNTVIWSNLNKFHNSSKRDFGGSVPFGPNLDSMIVGGMDELKNKRADGYFIINSTQTQLKYKREPGVAGGGLYILRQGQTVQPGYTLPAEFTLTKINPPFGQERYQ